MFVRVVRMAVSAVRMAVSGGFVRIVRVAVEVNPPKVAAAEHRHEYQVDGYAHRRDSRRDSSVRRLLVDVPAVPRVGVERRHLDEARRRLREQAEIEHPEARDRAEGSQDVGSGVTEGVRGGSRRLGVPQREEGEAVGRDVEGEVEDVGYDGERVRHEAAYSLDDHEEERERERHFESPQVGRGGGIVPCGARRFPWAVALQQRLAVVNGDLNAHVVVGVRMAVFGVRMAVSAVRMAVSASDCYSGTRRNTDR